MYERFRNSICSKMKTDTVKLTGSINLIQSNSKVNTSRKGEDKMEKVEKIELTSCKCGVYKILINNLQNISNNKELGD